MATSDEAKKCGEVVSSRVGRYRRYWVGRTADK
jgi:hypothetical protein